MQELKTYFNGEWKLAVVDATSIAREKLGVPIVNTTMLGALIKTSNLINMDSLKEPLKERFGAKAKNNYEACKEAFEKTAIVPDYPCEDKAGQNISGRKTSNLEGDIAGSRHYRSR